MYVPRNRYSLIFNVIFNTYGRAVLLAARRWEKLACRIADNYRKITFLHNCIREDLPPKSLRRKPVVNSLEGRRIVRQFQHRTMRAIINDLHGRNDNLITSIRNYREQCHAELTSQHFSLLNQHIRLVSDVTSRRATDRFRSRTERLRELKKGITPPDKLVYNLSSKALTHSQLSLLQRDVGYNLMDARPLDFMAALEPTLHRIGTEEAGDSIRHRVTGLLMGHKYYQTLSKNELEALGQLKEDDATLILPADKGRATVVMDRVHYTSKVLGLLSDATAYRTVSGDPMVTLKNRVNKVLNALKRGKRLDDETLARIRPSDTAAARFYGLPKVHKEGVPLRPIIAFRGTPTSELAKWLSHRIGHLVTDNQTTVRSAEEFLSRIRTLRIEDDEVMVSFDVISLFTSIPQDLAIATIKDLLSHRGPGHYQDSLRSDDLVDLLTLCLKTYFTFQGTMYEQIKGTPMGSPISSVIAEAVLQQLEHAAMAQYCPKFWARYVDDTFVIIKRSQKADFVDTLNSVCVDLQFTEEEEYQGKLAFLDVLVQRQPDGTLTTRVYRKPTHTDRILHYNSNHPVAHKVSCIRTLFKRVDSHCSTAEARTEERKHLLRLCRYNGYPMKFIRRHSTLSKPSQNPSSGMAPSQTTRITLPYISNISEATTRLLAPYGVRVAHRPDRTLRSCIMRPKDPLPIIERSGVVYRINCNDCPGNYVGETSKRVGTRMQEHKLAIRRGEQYSQILTHMEEFGHKFNFDDVRVVASDTSKSGRLLKEAWFSDNMSINRHVDLRPAYQTMKAWEMRRRPGKKHLSNKNSGCPLDETGSKEERHLQSRPPLINDPCVHPPLIKKFIDISGPSPDAPNTPLHCTQYSGIRTTSAPINTKQTCYPSDHIDSTAPNGAPATTYLVAGALEMDKNSKKATPTVSDGRITPLLCGRTDQSHRDRDMPPMDVQKINTYSRPVMGVVTRSRNAALRKAEREATGLRVAPDGTKEEHGGCDTLGAVGGNKSVDEIDGKDCGGVGGVTGLKTLKNENRDGIPGMKYRDYRSANEYDVCRRSGGEERSEEHRKKNQLNSAEDSLTLENTCCLYDSGTKGRGEVGDCADVSRSYKKESLKAVSEARVSRLGPVTRSMRRV